MGVVDEDSGAAFLKGGTNGLHALWGDPSNKLTSSSYLNPFPWVKPQVTQTTGPTAGVGVGTVIDYAWNANLLIDRPATSRDIYGFLNFCVPSATTECLSSTGTSNTTGTLTRYPGILDNRHAKGESIYFTFAPE